MQKVAVAVRRLILTLALFGIVYLAVLNYSFVFARQVKGEILDVAGDVQPTTVIAGTPNSTIRAYSFAVSIKEPSGEIVIASSEDRQWAVAKKGFCVEAKFYPYPPWNLEKAGTYYNARLVKLMECAQGASADN